MACRVLQSFGMKWKFGNSAEALAGGHPSELGEVGYCRAARPTRWGSNAIEIGSARISEVIEDWTREGGDIPTGSPGEIEVLASSREIG